MVGPETRVVLTVVEGPDEGKRFLLHGEPAVLGRKGADLVLTDERISRRHASLEWEGEGYTIRALGGRKGLEVGGRQVEEAPLEHLAELRLGETVIIVTVGLEESRGTDETFLGAVEGGTATDPGLSAAAGETAPGVTPAPPAAYLLVVRGPEKGRAFRLTEECTVLGRSQQEADIWVQEPLVSRRHAEVVRTGEGFQVRDLASSHGTTRNGEIVHEEELKDGDRLGLVAAELLFVLGEARLQEETEKLRAGDGD